MATELDYRPISTDDHIIEPPGVWDGRLESKFQDRAPHVIVEDDMDYWEFEGRRIPNIGLSVMAGRPYEEYTVAPVRFRDMRKGCYDPEERLLDMDRDGIEASALFPTIPGMAGTLFNQADDKDLGLRCLETYNDWLADTWCSTAPERFIGQMIVPLWDIDLAVKEFQRGISLGHKALSFPNAPESLGLPNIGDAHWDPLWDAVEEAGVPVSMHIASGSMRDTQLPLEVAGGTPAEVFVTVAPSSNFVSVATLLWSGVLDRHPKLRFLSVEGGIGWLGYLVQRADEVYVKHRHWTHAVIKEKPSFYFKRQVFANFLDDEVGLAIRHYIGIENIMFEVDYPHSDTTFPNSTALVSKRFKDVPPDETRMIVRDNAIKFFGLNLD
ncbi:MAG: amidohydrolase family protein [Myxococcota bacterium]|jgi:predicted TIM-barrel fold metal-dependent hydrolase|nr:amidohydrolase [Deltaproteobacteria bacterium]MCP4242766.1 amidohydrolase [bacterium]MDP7075288.1 amidohydrolase family protein [Myxococcota bacterium]MDP7299158.1 amidohydrolase family protein [Myxococcota bacterium]MDP7434342.1 amidohydrolase family protein [Myxococcota bacterium]